MLTDIKASVYALNRQCKGASHFSMTYIDRQGLITWIFPRTPVLSIRLATFTVFPQMSYCGFWAPMTPAITGPWLIPGDGQQNVSKYTVSHGVSLSFFSAFIYFV